MAISTPTVISSGNNGLVAADTQATASFAVTAGNQVVLMCGIWQTPSTTALTFTINSQTHTGTWTWASYTSFQTNPGNYSLAVGFFVATAPASSSGVVTFGFTGGTSGNVKQWRWAELTMTGAASAIQQSAGNKVTTAVTLTVTLAALGSNSIVIAGAYDVNGTDLVPGASGGWTELYDIGVNACAFEGMYSATPTTTPNWTSTTAGLVAGGAIEILPAATSTPSMPPWPIPAPTIMTALVT